jgi:hypothetical protein
MACTGQAVNAKWAERLSVKDFGALGDGVTDDTAAIHSAIAACNTALKSLYFPAGIYRCNIIAEGRTPMCGEGMARSQLQSFSAGEWALSLTGVIGTWQYCTIRDLGFIGDSDYGVRLGPAAYVTNCENVGRWAFDSCLFNTKIGVYKPYGNIGNSYRNCAFQGGTGMDFGFYAYAAAAGYAMHAGCDLFENCEFHSYEKSAVFVNSLNSAECGQTAFRHCVFEANHYMNICVYNYPGTGEPVVTLDDVWFESNASESTVTINTSDPTAAGGVAFTPRDLYVRNGEVRMVNTPFKSVELVNASLYADVASAGSDLAELVMDADSVCVVSNGTSNGAISTDVFTDSPLHYQRVAGNTAALCRTRPRSIVSGGYTPIYSVTFDASPPNFVGTATLTPTIVKDGVLFDTCAEYTFSASQDERLAEIALTAAKYTVVSFDLKRVSGTGGTLAPAVGSTMYATRLIPAETGRWFSFCGVFDNGAGMASTTPLRVVMAAGVSTVLRFSALQLLEFDTKQQATEYARSRVYTVPTTRPRWTHGAVAPTTGTWTAGDMCWHTDPASKANVGWVYTGAAWEPFGMPLSGGITIGSGEAGVDYSVTFDGETTNGVFTWMEDEDYLKASDSVLMDTAKEVYFRDTAIHIKSGDDGHLDLTADTSIDLNGLALTQNVQPIANDTYYLGKNSISSPLAYKGIVLKDTTDGKYYRIEVISGVITPTEVT